MPEISNTFIQGVMNKDLDERLIPSGVYVDALNITVDTSDSGNIGAAKNQLGNTKVADIYSISGVQPTNAKTIGSTCSEKDGLVYWLVACDQFDAIFEYNQNTGLSSRVLQCSKSGPSSPSVLNFNKDFIVTGINYVNGFLYWTDNYNPPRKINIARVKSSPNGIGGYNIDDPRIADDINVILAPPLHSPKIKLEPNDTSQSNNIEEKFLYFAYRYKYIDDQYSAMSPFSSVAFKPKDYVLDYNIGNNKSMTNRYNQAKITVFTGSQFVKEVQLLMFDTRNLNVSIVETFNKQDLLIPDETFRQIEFNNNKTYSVLPYDQVTRLFDNVPLFAKAQEFVGNRIMYGNYTQFYNVVEDVRLDLSYKSIDNPNLGEPIQSFRSDRDYEVGLIYLDEYGRSTTVLTSANNTTYIPATQSDKGNTLRLQIYNNPPTWATNYRVVIKQSKGSYYNLFPIYFYTKNQFRYFLIHESDRDKVPVGDYVIFKSTASGPTYSNKRYKVIELKLQEEGFEGITGAQAGLYFKIKVDSPTELNSNAGVQLYWMESYSRGDVGSVSSESSLLNNPSLGTPDTSLVENPIYYGDNNGGALSLTPITTAYPALLTSNDYRITIQVVSSTEFRWTSDITGTGQWNGNYTISIGTPFPINVINSSPGNNFYITWNSQPSVGDIWKINIRSTYTNNSSLNYFGGIGVNNKQAPRCALTLDITTDATIYPGDVIEIKYNETGNPNASNKSQVFYSNSTYENIEEWFVESGAYLDFKYVDIDGSSKDYKAVSFRRGTNLYTNKTNPFGWITYLDLDSQNQNFLNYPVYMIITGNENSWGAGTGANKMSASIYVRHLTNQIIAETVPDETDLDIYHELSRTFKIENNRHHVTWDYANYTEYNSNNISLNGKTVLGPVTQGSPTSTDVMHNYVAGDYIYVRSSLSIYGIVIPYAYYQVLYVPDPYSVVIDYPFIPLVPVQIIPGSTSYADIDQNQTNFQPAIIQINNPLYSINSDFNSWSYSNGLETYRIRDDWNAATLQYSPRASSTVDGYGQKISNNAICYSGIYGQNTGVNELNEFNLSIANFKYLDGEFGPIQKLHGRDTDLLVFQENKISAVLYGKNLLSDAVGGGQIASVPEILGTQIAFPGEYGISKNPESFAVWGDDMFCTDANRGAVLQISGNQIAPISSNGMKDYFIDMMQNYGDTQKLGAYDPHNHLYTLSSNTSSILGCKLSIDKTKKIVNVNGTFGNLLTLFSIYTDSSWVINLQNLGFGTNWVTGYVSSGTGNADISALVSQNTTGAVRSVKFMVYYCGNIAEFILEQGRSKDINVVTIVKNNKIPR